jgi:phosphate transport system ATP-binding protein
MSHISLRSLTVRYGGYTAIKDISVDLPDGKIIAIIGPSGCGKTTLLKSINRLLELSDNVEVEGKVLIDGVNIYDPDSDVISLRKKVGFLSQKPYPLPMSIYDNITFGPKIHGISGDQILQLINRHRNLFPFDWDVSRGTSRYFKGRKNREQNLLVEFYLKLSGLWDDVKERLDAPAAKLSVGQQQRLALARALAVEPEVILADEPTSALDPVNSQLIEHQFKILKNQYTIVVVTHILRQARRIADYVVFLYMGELVEHGPAEEIFENPSNEKTKAYITGSIS